MPPKRFATLVPMDTERIYGPANKYDPEYCDRVRVYGQEGMFPEEWCAHIGVTMPTLFNWDNAHPEFERAMHEAWWLLRAYWSRRARDSVQGAGMAPSVLMAILETRFPDTWGKNPRNTHETFERCNNLPEVPTEGGGVTPITNADDLDVRIAELGERRGAYIQPTLSTNSIRSDVCTTPPRRASLAAPPPPPPLGVVVAQL